MKKRKSTILYSLFLVLLSLVLFGGCGSAGKDGAVTAETVNAGNVGDTACVQCHSAVADPLTGESVIAQYQNTSPHMDSEHANDGNGCEACHGGGSLHFGDGPIAYPNPYEANGVRCTACHKGDYPTNAPTKFADSNHATVAIKDGSACRRCHSHEGAVLGGAYGFTGDEHVLDNEAYAGAVPLQKEFSAFTCATCHEHGAGLRQVKARDHDGNIITWNPSGSNLANDQFNLCTSCHTMYDYTGDLLLSSGTPSNLTTGKPDTGLAGHHGGSWYRVIATTHYDNPATGLDTTDGALTPGNIIEGYNIRMEGEKPCFDCHGHEANTNTGQVADASIAEADKPNTIHTEWAQSGHAGGLLKAKIAAANEWPNHRDRTSPEGAYATDSAMVSGVSETNSGPVDITATLKQVKHMSMAWTHYQWERTQKADGTSDRGTCQRCHTATGASNYLNDPSGYDYLANDFSHLSGWKARTSTAATTPSAQQEMLYCWGCHSNAGVGTLRNPGAITADYKFDGVKAQFPDVGASNVCIACHSGLESGEAVATMPTASFSNASFKNSHYMAAAGLMYVKNGFTAFTAATNTIGSSTTTYGESLTSTEDGGALRSTHRHFGGSEMIGDHGITAEDTQFLSGGPCVTCHMTGKHHTLEIDENAVNNVCLKCHDSELGTELTAANFETHFLEPQSEVFQDALSLANAVLTAKFNIEYDSHNYPYIFPVGMEHIRANGVTDWTLGGTLTGDQARKLMGACFNINLLSRDPAAYAHARTYARRLLYDTIDFLDDKTINLSSGATAVATLPAVYTKGAKAFTGSQSDPTTTLAPGTSEAMTYLLGWSRTSGSWSDPERP